jgi:hypothetical protein
MRHAVFYMCTYDLKNLHAEQIYGDAEFGGMGVF